MLNVSAAVYGLGYTAPREAPPSQGILPADPHVQPAAIPRLRGINATVLAAFQTAPDRTLTNSQLAAITARYGARIYDIREAGYSIDLIEENHKTGLSRYRLNDSMKAISLWQPWASLIAVGAKRYETRGWMPPPHLIGQRLAICSAKTMDGMTLMERGGGMLARICSHWLNFDTLPFGAVVAVAKVGQVIDTEEKTSHGHTAREEATGDWAPGRKAWRLDDVIPLEDPVPVIGKQGLFDLPADVFAAVVGQIAGQA